MHLDELVLQRGGTRIGPVDATFEPGRITLLTGPSGAGKTSMCLAMTGLLDPAEIVGGRIGGGPAALVPQNPREWLDPRTRIGRILDRTARAGGGRLSLPQRRLLLERVGLDPRLMERPASALSGGQAARACLARALATGRGTIVCDEATAALDAIGAAELVRLLTRVAASGIAVAWATHDLDLARAALGRDAPRVHLEGPTH